MRHISIVLISLLVSACAATPKTPDQLVSRAPKAVVEATLTEQLLTAGTTYVTYAEGMPTSHYFEILQPLNCDHWFWLTELKEASQVQGNKQYFIKRRSMTESSWPAQCFKKMHKILSETNDSVLKAADGVIFDYDQFRIVNKGTPIIGYHHVFMPGWAIRFKDPTPVELLDRLKSRPANVVEWRQIEAAAKASGRQQLKEAIPLLVALIQRNLVVQEGLRDNVTAKAVLEGLALMPAEDVDQEIWWSLLEGGARSTKTTKPDPSKLKLNGYAGAAAVIASRALFCANRPGLLERMTNVFATTLELDRMLAAAMTIAAIDPVGFDRLQRTVGATAGTARFANLVRGEGYFRSSECVAAGSQG